MVQPHIAAVTVNHNTSHFVELMARTLFLKNDLQDILTLTVLDNGSDDEHLPALQLFLKQTHSTFTQTGFDTTTAVEKHGVALQSFVLQNSTYSHFLFLDADMWFMEPNTIDTMMKELRDADSNIFANQARIIGYYAGRVIEGHDKVPSANVATDVPSWHLQLEDRSYHTSGTSRCSPVCSLVRNTPLFREVVAMIGLTPALILAVDTATYFDTFGLMTRVMATHNQQFMVSSAVVNHFTQTTYQLEFRSLRDQACLEMLARLRSGHGFDLPIFYESEWVRQQRTRTDIA